VEGDEASVISSTTSSAATPSPPSPAEDMPARRGWFGYGRSSVVMTSQRFVSGPESRTATFRPKPNYDQNGKINN
jgi:hypothetical protein